MRTLVLLLVCVALISPLSAFGKQAKAAPVVAKFGGECQGRPFGPSSRLERLIQKTKQREVSPCDWPFCGGAFAYDLNGDGGNEYFVRLGCGATGNCTWGVFSDSPARLHGTFTAWFFYIHRGAGGWSALSTYTREGGDQGVITTLSNRRGKYIQTSERTERGYYGNPQPFLKSMGVPKCDVSGAAQPTTPCSRPRIAVLSCARLAANHVVCAAADGHRYAPPDICSMRLLKILFIAAVISSSGCSVEHDRIEAKKAAERIHSQLQSQDYASVYRESGKSFRDVGDESKFVAGMKLLYEENGSLKTATPIAYQSGVDSEAGRNHVLIFNLEFERGRAEERMVLTRSTNGQMQLWDLAIDPIP